MPKIVITSQAQWDELPPAFDEYTELVIGDGTYVSIKKISGKASAILSDNARASLYGNASAALHDNASATLSGNAIAALHDNASATLSDSARATLYGNANAILSGSARATLSGNARASLYGNASAALYGNANAILSGNAIAALHDNASATLSDSASATLYDSASATLYDSASAKAAWRSVIFRDSPTAKASTIGPWARVQEPVSVNSTADWLSAWGLDPAAEQVILFKRVSSDLRTQEGTPNETTWKIGTTITHPNWSPDDDECGPGKFHACPRPELCDQFRNKPDDRYIAIRVAVEDLHVWVNGKYPHKVAFRRGEVLFECDRDGNKVAPKEN